MVSIIVPNYNHAKFLAQRIESILSQSYQDFEIILLDDCSTDNSREIIEQYRTNPKITHIVYNEKNSGNTFRQWKKGFDLAIGDYIWIAESDDFATPNFLETIMHYFFNSPSIVLAYTNSKLVDCSNKILKLDLDYWESSKKGADIISAKSFIKKKMLYRNNIYNASAVVFKRDVLQNINMEYIYNYKLCGDWLFWCLVIYNGEICHIYDKYNYFRQHDQKVTPKSVKAGLDISEGFSVFRHILTLVDVSKFKERMVAGSFFYRILVSKLDSNLKHDLWKIWSQHYNPLLLCLYVIYHIPVFLRNKLFIYYKGKITGGYF